MAITIIVHAVSLKAISNLFASYSQLIFISALKFCGHFINGYFFPASQHFMLCSLMKLSSFSILNSDFLHHGIEGCNRVPQSAKNLQSILHLLSPPSNLYLKLSLPRILLSSFARNYEPMLGFRQALLANSNLMQASISSDLSSS